MLDTQHEIDAFRLLQSTGLSTPASIKTCRAAATLAEAAALDFSQLRNQLSGYNLGSELTGYIDTFSSCRTGADGLINSINPWLTPSQIMQLKVGWECHIKTLAGQSGTFWLNEGIGDTVITTSMLDAMKAIDSKVVTQTVNNLVATATGKTPTNDAKAAYLAATTSLKAPFSKVEACLLALSALTSNVNASTSAATKALQTAVDITLAKGLITDPVMNLTIAGILPASIMNKLRG